MTPAQRATRDVCILVAILVTSSIGLGLALGLLR